MNRLSRHAASPSTQRGATLAVALILMLALTILGIAAMGGNKLQSRMAYGVSETTVAFQAAESAIISGEQWLQSQTGLKPVTGCVQSTTSTSCNTTATDAAYIWKKETPASTSTVTLTNLLDNNWWTNYGRRYGYSYAAGTVPALQTGQTMPGVAVQPRYVVQEIGKDPTSSLGLGQGISANIWYYEVSGVGTGAQPVDSEKTDTVTQSVYAKLF